MQEFGNIYETMLGEREESYQVPGVLNEFEENSYCAREYEDMREAYLRICERLGVGDEDMDLEIMVTALGNIQKELCLRSYKYGYQSGVDSHKFDSWIK